MKLSGRDAVRYFKAPDPDRAGLLIYGEDAMRVALRRQDVIAALLGPAAEEEMRLTRTTGTDLRRDGAVLLDGIKEQGFFPGPRVVFVDEATDGLADLFQAALEAWAPGDAQIVATAGRLNARSALRKAFETSRQAVAIGIYDDPPSREEIEATLKAAGLTAIDPDAMADLQTLSHVLDPGDFRQTVERIALYKLNDSASLSTQEVARLAPQSIEAGVDDVLDIVADGRAEALGPVLARLRDQGVTPVTLVIAATRHFRLLHQAASDPGGPGVGIAKLRPPVFGPRRDRMQRQARAWGMHRLEDALRLLIDTDLTLRSAGHAPGVALIERAFLRLAKVGARR